MLQYYLNEHNNYEANSVTNNLLTLKMSLKLINFIEKILRVYWTCKGFLRHEGHLDADVYQPPSYLEIKHRQSGSQSFEK